MRRTGKSSSSAEDDGDPSGRCRVVADQPYIDTTSHDGKPWSEIDRVRPWDSLSADEQRLFARMAEVYAGFLSHADHELGRLLDYLEDSDQLDNTIIVLVSDNGASGEGGPNGSVNENKFFNGLPDRPRRTSKLIDELGGFGPTTIIRPGGRGRSTRRSRCGSATPTMRVVRPIR